MRAVLLIALLALIATLSFFGSRWWTQRERQRALSIYIQKTSPVTLRMPKDTLLYINFYRLRLVYSRLENTRLYRVLAHWLDTGMKDKEDKPNPVLGGMLEKMLLNVLGEELGIALIPAAQQGGEFEIVAVAQLTQGSDFLLRLALSQNKKLGRVPMDDSTVYTHQTRDPRFPLLYIYVDSDFAIVTNNIDRLKAARSPGSGPQFLAQSEQLALPEQTFLFARSADPSVSLTAHQEEQRLHVQVRSAALLTGALPARMGGSPAIELLSNAPRLLRQPSVAMAVHNVGGNAASSIVFAFQEKHRAETLRIQLEERYTEGLAEEQLEELKTAEVECLRFPHRSRTRMICTKGQLLLQADGDLNPLEVLADAGVEASQKRPLTVNIQFRKEAVREFGELADNNDWSRFSVSRAFYFLGCIRQIRGGVGAGQGEIVVELE